LIPGENSHAQQQPLRRNHHRTGAGGGTLAYRLAPSGNRILILERGDFVAREKDNWSTRAVNGLGNTRPRNSGWT